MHIKVRNVKSGEKLGKILVNAREKKELSRARFAKKHFLSLSCITALEKGDYGRLPEYVYAGAQLKSYAKLLGLNEKALLKLFNEEYYHWKNLVKNSNPKQTNRVLFGTKRSNSFALTPAFFQKSAFLIAGFILISYIGFQVDAAIAPAELSVYGPDDRLTTTEETVHVTGKTGPESNVSINNHPVTVEDDGSFDMKVNLHPGLNTLEIIATKKYRPENKEMRHIILEEK